MDLPFVGVEGHQKPLENTETLMKIDVCLCLVVREPGFYRGAPPPRTPPFYLGLVALTQGLAWASPHRIGSSDERERRRLVSLCT